MCSDQVNGPEGFVLVSWFEVKVIYFLAFVGVIAEDSIRWNWIGTLNI